MDRHAYRFEIVSIPVVLHEQSSVFPGTVAINRDIHIIHILRGRGMMRIGEQASRIEPGRAFWIPPLTRYACGKAGGEPLEMVNIHFHLELAGVPITSMARMPMTFTMPGALPDRLRTIGELWHRDDRMARGSVAVQVHSLIVDHLDRHAKRREETRSPDVRMTDLRDRLESIPEQAYDACRMAKQVHLSVSQMNRLFRDAFGMSPRVFHEQRRLAHAQLLLRHDESPIKVVAEQLGFCDAFYFSRWFTRHVGLSPSRFRRERGGI